MDPIVTRTTTSNGVGPAKPAGSVRGPVRFGFILLPGFTLTAFSGVVDVLRLASDEGDRSRPIRCTWAVIAETPASIRSSCGVQLIPSELLGDPSRFDYLVVVGGLLRTHGMASAVTLDYIRRAAAAGATLVGSCTGVFALARAGVMDGHRLCVSWFHYWDFIERFPRFERRNIVADCLYVIDGRRITCSGGRASIDVAAEILRAHMDPSIVQKALRILLVDAVARRGTAQPMPPGVKPFADPAVRRAILLMEQNVSHPLTAAELSSQVGASLRQLERLFKDATGLTPHAYAQHLRLRFAAWMLARTERTATDIAMECGFADASHLGREFRSTYGVPPNAWRQQARSGDLLPTDVSVMLQYMGDVHARRRDLV